MIVDWAESAFVSMKMISNYLVSVSREDVAKRMMQDVYEKANTLSTFPLRGRVVSNVNDPHLREISCHRYRIIYEIDSLETPSRAVVLSVIHDSQILENTLLADRLTVTPSRE